MQCPGNSQNFQLDITLVRQRGKTVRVLRDSAVLQCFDLSLRCCMLFSPVRVGCTRAMRGFCVMHAFTRMCLYVCVSCSHSTMYTETMVLIFTMFRLEALKVLMTQLAFSRRREMLLARSRRCRLKGVRRMTTTPIVIRHPAG